jgi:aminoglycoside phosphotransferase (APT) family kinase protein
MERLSSLLAADMPTSGRTCLVHGDYRLDNCLVDDGRISAVLDWEMSTLGDPVADLATFVVYHDGLADLPNPVVESPGRLPDVPPLAELLERYADRSGHAIHDFEWYLAFAWFKLAVILAGVSHRAEHGQTAGQQFVGADALVEPCITRGLEAIGS